MSIDPEKLLVLFVIAVLVLGPDRLPQMARSLGRGLAELRKYTSAIRSEVDEVLAEPRAMVSAAAHEAEMLSLLHHDDDNGSVPAGSNGAASDLVGLNGDATSAHEAGPDLVGPDLVGSGFVGAGLASSDLAGDGLGGPDVDGADLAGPGLASSDLASSDLAGSYLDGAGGDGASVDAWDDATRDEFAPRQATMQWVTPPAPTGAPDDPALN